MLFIFIEHTGEHISLLLALFEYLTVLLVLLFHLFFILLVTLLDSIYWVIHHRLLLDIFSLRLLWYIGYMVSNDRL